MKSNKSITLKIKKSRLTRILIIINLLFFIAEIVLGGSENIDTLYNLGALVPQEVWQGELWRLLTANFLHYGWLHLLVNMIGLYFLGGVVESNLNTYYYLIIYFTSGIGAMLAFSYLALKTNNTGYILVGASAAIMGLFGSVTTLFLRNFFQQRSRLATRQLKFILLIIFIQFTSDLLIPKISFMAHFLGFIIGLITGFLLLKFPLK